MVCPATDWQPVHNVFLPEQKMDRWMEYYSITLFQIFTLFYHQIMLKEKHNNNKHSRGVVK